MIKKSREVQKAAKQAIYALQRDDKQKARQLLAQCEAWLRTDLLPVTATVPELREGAVSSCVEEYVEAKLFEHYVLTDGAIPATRDVFPAGVDVKSDEYLGGLMDATGEVQRHGVLGATRGDVRAAERARDYVDFCMGKMMLFDLRKWVLVSALGWCAPRRVHVD